MLDMDPVTEECTKHILGAAFEVSNLLGHGFLEAVYRRALLREFALRETQAEEEVRFPVEYKGSVIGLYVADLVVGGRVIVELKAVDELSRSHMAQVLNYLRVSGLQVAMLLNFGKPRLEYRRVLAQPGWIDLPRMNTNEHE